MFFFKEFEISFHKYAYTDIDTVAADMSSKRLGILHEWSFHMKLMKRAFGEFYKFHIN